MELPRGFDILVANKYIEQTKSEKNIEAIEELFKEALFHLENNKPFPKNLAQYFASALNTALTEKNPKNKGQQLLISLGFKNTHRRHKVTFLEVGEWLDLQSHTVKGFKDQSKEHKDYSIHEKFGISERTATTKRIEYEAYIKKIKEEEIESMYEDLARGIEP